MLWAASACVGGPISDLPHSGDDDTSAPPRTSDAGNAGSGNIDAGLAPDSESGDGGADAGDTGLPLPDGGLASGPVVKGDPCDDVPR